MDLKRIATETLAAFETDGYLSPEGVTVKLSALLDECLEGTREYRPEQLADLLSRLPHPSSTGVATTFTVSPEFKLQGAARLPASGEYQRIVGLNFASARKPGVVCGEICMHGSEAAVGGSDSLTESDSIYTQGPV